MRNKGRTIGLTGVILLTFALVSLYFQLDFPEPTGPYAVGRLSQHWVDTSRMEDLASNPDDFRELPVQIWFPAETNSGTRAPYFLDLDRVAQGLATSGEVSPIEIFGLRYIKSHGRLNANLSTAAAQYPLIIFSPGNGTNVEFYAGIADELASYGYIVIGINHPYDVAAAELQDGSVVQFNPGPIEFQEHEKWVVQRINVRTDDVLFALKELERLNVDKDSLLASHLDLTHVGVMGHSLGGITAAEACSANAAFASCLNLDGIQRGGPFSTRENPTPPDQPFMMITKEKKLPQASIALFNAVQSGSYRVVINEAKHDNFTDGPLLQPGLLPLPGPADRILAITRTFTLEFLNQTLKQQPSLLLEKSFQNQEVSLEVYP